MKKNKGFTIVELLVVIVVIGILAIITIVSFSGIRQKASIATLQSDLKNASTQLEVYKTTSNDESYPIDQATANLRVSSGTTITYARSNATNYCVEATNSGMTYRISSSDKKITPGVCLLASPDWMAIGTQVWAKYNLNVGTRTAGTNNQTDDSTIEKYCYNNNESNCTTYGGLYQWGEAMQYVTTAGAQGICPAGSHIPSDNDWKILEIQLGMTQEQADTINQWRGTDQGTQLKSGGSSGLNIPLAGYRRTDGTFISLSTGTYLWSSSEYDGGGYAWDRLLSSGQTTVNNNANEQVFGFSVRCVGNN